MARRNLWGGGCASPAPNSRHGGNPYFLLSENSLLKASPKACLLLDVLLPWIVTTFKTFWDFLIFNAHPIACLQSWHSEFSLIYLTLCMVSHWPLHPSHSWDFVPDFNHSPSNKSAGFKSSSSIADQFFCNRFQTNIWWKSEFWHYTK